MDITFLYNLGIQLLVATKSSVNTPFQHKIKTRKKRKIAKTAAFKFQNLYLFLFSWLVIPFVPNITRGRERVGVNGLTVGYNVFFEMIQNLENVMYMVNL